MGTTTKTLIWSTVPWMLMSCISLVWGCTQASPPSPYPDELLLAISQNNDAQIRSILRKEPRLVDVALITGQTPMYFAVLEDHTVAAKALLDAGADPSQMSRGIISNTVDAPLTLAVRVCSLELVKLLLNAETAKFFSERDLSDAIVERRWQSGCDDGVSASIEEYISAFLDP